MCIQCSSLSLLSLSLSLSLFLSLYIYVCVNSYMYMYTSPSVGRALPGHFLMSHEMSLVMFECTHLLELCLYLLESSIVVMIIRNVNILVQGLVYTCLKTCMYTCVQPTHQLEHTHTLTLSLCLSVSLYIFTLYYICTHCTMIGHDDNS